MTATELFEQAEIKLGEKAYKDSIRLYTEAIVLDNTNAHFISQRAVAFFHMNKFEEALYDFNHAIEIEPENPFRYSSRAFMLSNMNRISEAIKDYEKAIELDPTDSVAYNNLGLLQEGVGFNELAKQNYDKADNVGKVGLNGSTQIVEQKDDDISDQSENPILDPEIKELGESYRDMGYFQFIKMIFTHKKVRNDFFKFIRNGFKLK